MQALLWPVVSWIVREIVVKFIVFAALFALLSLVGPLLMGYASAWTPQKLTDAFSGLAPGVWWFLDKFALDIGVPMLLSANIAAFLIRRLPVVG